MSVVVPITSHVIVKEALSFVNRMTQNLELDRYAINQSIENIMTTSQETLLDFDLRKLINFKQTNRDRNRAYNNEYILETKNRAKTVFFDDRLHEKL